MSQTDFDNLFVLVAYMIFLCAFFGIGGFICDRLQERQRLRRQAERAMAHIHLREIMKAGALR